MYAIIETGGKQFRVEKDDVIDIELIEAQDGEKVEFKNVLFLNTGASVHVGTPYIAGKLVQGEVLGEEKGPKVTIFKYKRRKPFRRKVGHRQRYSRVKITEIVG